MLNHFWAVLHLSGRIIGYFSSEKRKSGKVHSSFPSLSISLPKYRQLILRVRRNTHLIYIEIERPPSSRPYSRARKEIAKSEKRSRPKFQTSFSLSPLADVPSSTGRRATRSGGTTWSTTRRACASTTPTTAATASRTGRTARSRTGPTTSGRQSTTFGKKN